MKPINLNLQPHIYKLPHNWLYLFLNEAQLGEFYGWGEQILIAQYFVDKTYYILKFTRYDDDPGLLSHEWQLEIGLEKHFNSEKQFFEEPEGVDSKITSFFFTEVDKNLYIFWGEYIEMIKMFKTLQIPFDNKDTLSFNLMEQDDIETFISLALTGNPWASIASKEYIKMKDQIISEGGKSSIITRDEIYARLLIEGKEVLIFDKEESALHLLTLEKLDEGLKIVKNKYGSIYQEFKDQDGDLNTGDVILQCAIFGDIIYG